MVAPTTGRVSRAVRIPRFLYGMLVTLAVLSLLSLSYNVLQGCERHRSQVTSLGSNIVDPQEVSPDQQPHSIIHDTGHRMGMKMELVSDRKDTEHVWIYPRLKHMQTL